MNQPNGTDLKGVRVLIVEDTWHTATAMKAALERVEMVVIGPTATTSDARRLIATHKPSLALIDVNLKGEMAGGLIEELHAQGIPVIVASGYAVPAVAKEKVVRFLQKPFSGGQLIEAIRAAVSAEPATG
jgi:DNA-binding NtrC family response regulator